MAFIGAEQVTLTGGTGSAAVFAAGGNNTFTAGAGSLDATAGGGTDAYVFHATSGLLTIENFSVAKGDTLTIDKLLQASMTSAFDGAGGTMMTFGANHSIDLRGVAVVPTGAIHWA